MRNNHAAASISAKSFSCKKYKTHVLDSAARREIRVLDTYLVHETVKALKAGMVARLKLRELEQQES